MSRWIDEDHNSHTEPGIGGDEKQARLNPRQRYNRWADAKIAELEKEIKFLKDLDAMQRKREQAEDINAPMRRA